MYHGRIQRGVYRGSAHPPPPWKNHKNIGFSSNTGSDPWKIAATRPAFNVGPSSARRVSLVGRWWPVYSGTWILPPLINLKEKGNVVKVGHPLTKFSGSAHDVPCRPHSPVVLPIWSSFYTSKNNLCKLCEREGNLFAMYFQRALYATYKHACCFYLVILNKKGMVVVLVNSGLSVRVIPWDS